MIKHTPGPWHVIEHKHGQAFTVGTTVQAKGNLLTTHSIAKIDVLPTEQALANAHLIAAAPQMLEALEWACDERVNWHLCEADCYGAPPCMADACPIYEAIKAAKGEKS